MYEKVPLDTVQCCPVLEEAPQQRPEPPDTSAADGCTPLQMETLECFRLTQLHCQARPAVARSWQHPQLMPSCVAHPGIETPPAPPHLWVQNKQFCCRPCNSADPRNVAAPKSHSYVRTLCNQCLTRPGTEELTADLKDGYSRDEAVQDLRSRRQ
jgi:hypothetical protein